MSTKLTLHNAVQQAVLDVEEHVKDAMATVDPIEGTNIEIVSWATLQEAMLSYDVFSLLKAQCERIIKAAKAHVVLEGGFNVNSVAVGEVSTVIDGALCDLQLKVRSPASRLDSAKLITALRSAGVSKEIVDECVKNATVFNSPAKVFTTIYKD